jgi:hypothetical protein
MGRSLKSNDSLVFGNIITDRLVTNGLLSPQAGSENIIGYTFISGATTLPDIDGAYVIESNSSFTVNLPNTSTDGRLIQIVDGANFSVNNKTLGRNGNTINGVAENLVLNVSTSFFLIYKNNNWITKFYR